MKKEFNKNLIINYDKSLEDKVNHFLTTIDQESINKMRDILSNKYKNRFEIDFKDIIDILQDPNLTKTEKNMKILNRSEVIVNSEISLFSLNNKVEGYCHALEEVIKENLFDLKDADLRNLFITIGSKSERRTHAMSTFYENTPFVVVSIIAKCFNSVKTTEDAVLLQQSLISSIGNLFIETFAIIHHKLDDDRNQEIQKQKEEKKEYYIEALETIEKYKNDIISLEQQQQKLLSKDRKIILRFGAFLLDCILKTPLETIDDEGNIVSSTSLLFRQDKRDQDTAKQKIYYGLTQEGKDILSILPKYGSVYPSIDGPFIFWHNKKNNKYFAHNKVFSINMYKYSDVHGIRDDNTKISKGLVDCLNYLQKTKFVINKRQLDYIKENLLEFYLIYSNFTYTCITHEKQEQYVDEYLTFLRLRGTKITQLHIDLSAKEYRTEEILLEKFISIIGTAETFKDQILYFNHSTDFRGRIYPTGYPLNPQGDFISRSLLSLNNIEDLLGHDVSGSGFQILGLLSGDKKTLELTNFIKRDIYKSTEYKDLYEYMMKGFISYFKKKGLSRIYKIYHQKRLVGEFEIDLNKLFDRTLIKKLSMCYIYGETAYSRANKIKDQFYNIYQHVLSSNQSNEIAKSFTDFLNEEFENLTSIKDFITNLSNIITKKGPNCYTKICADEDHISTVLTYMKEKKHHLSCMSKNSGYIKKVLFYLPIYPPVIDKRKTERSITANYIHMIDSVLAMKVILHCKEENIKIFTVHDSFYVDKIHTKRIKEIYYMSALETFIKSNDKKPPLELLVESNKEHLSNSEYENQKRKIQTFIQNTQEILQKNEMNGNILKIESPNIYDKQD